MFMTLSIEGTGIGNVLVMRCVPGRSMSLSTSPH